MIINNPINQFEKVILVDMDFVDIEGELPLVHNVRLKDIKNNETLDSTDSILISNLSANHQVLFISRDFGNAMRCYLSLEWPLPINYIDLNIEEKNFNNGYEAVDGACSRLTCDSHVSDLLGQLTLPFALLRGQYLKTSALIEQSGIPFDVDALAGIRDQKEQVKKQLIRKYDSYHIFVDGAFSTSTFSKLLVENRISWPVDSFGKLILDKEVFSKRAEANPILYKLYLLRRLLSKLREFRLPVGTDARNRCKINPFSSKTSRNQPSNSDFIFGQPAWLRGLIKPTKGTGIAYIDYSQQEFGIAAALSGDKNMQKAYQSGDPYLAFAIQAGAAPIGATKQSHKSIREQFKACTLAVQYGMSAASFANVINQQLAHAEELIALHHSTYHVFWSWSDAIIDYAMSHHQLQTVYDWRFNFESAPNPRFLRNFPMQANGAEMLRLACSMLVDEGIKVCAPVHDAVLIEMPLNQLDSTVRKAKQIMSVASSTILNGFALNSDIDIVRYPNRFQDVRGAEIWNLFKHVNQPRYYLTH